jgi:hypothetical protein
MLTRSGSPARRVGLSAVFALACSLPFAVPALAQCLGACPIHAAHL